MSLPRLLPLVGAAVAAPAVLVLGVAGGAGPLPVLALLAVAAGLVVLRRRSPAALVDVGWGREPAPPPAVIGEPAPPPAVIGEPAPAPAVTTGRGGGSVVRSLARAEARDLAANGWMAGAVGFCLLFLVLTGGILADDFERSWWGYTSVLLLFAHPACGFSLVAVHRAVTRGARDRVEELYQACPVDSATRARGHLVSGLAIVAGMALFAGVMTVAVAVRSTAMYGPFDGRVAADLVLVPVLAFGAVAVGVALGRCRWARWSLAPVLAVVAIAVVEQALFEAGDVGGKVGGLTAFGIWSEGDPIFFEPRTAARLVWFAGMSAAMAGVALLPGRRTGAPLRLVGVGLAVALVGAAAVLWPLPAGTADRLAAYVADPGPHETCEEVEAGMRVCVLAPYARLGEVYTGALRPVAAALPDGAFAGPVTLRTLFDGRRVTLAREVKLRLPDPLPAPAPGVVRLALQHTQTHLSAARFRLAAAAVGLPTEAPASGTPEVVAGQARGVLVLWYATRGLTPADAGDALEPDPHAESPGPEGDVWPSYCLSERPLLWGPTDLAAAGSLLSLPEARVNRALAGGWDRWTDPATPTDDLLLALGLPPLGPGPLVPALPRTGC